MMRRSLEVSKPLHAATNQTGSPRRRAPSAPALLITTRRCVSVLQT
jgi:hypothetical protein